jgi:hypothetical protein
VKCPTRLALVFGLAVLAMSPLNGQDVPASTSQNAKGNTVTKPTRKPDQVITNDPIALLAVRRTPASAASDVAAKDESAAGVTETARKAAEIASVEQQIQDKQKRIVLLMRLFVNDERRFLNDPANVNVEPAIVERRRYEQDELHWETAELARLKTRLPQFRRAKALKTMPNVGALHRSG